jgi:hypothetical protein
MLLLQTPERREKWQCRCKWEKSDRWWDNNVRSKSKDRRCCAKQRGASLKSKVEDGRETETMKSRRKLTCICDGEDGTDSGKVEKLHQAHGCGRESFRMSVPTRFRLSVPGPRGLAPLAQQRVLSPSAPLRTNHERDGQ